jgi:hypothetical protein
MYGDVSVESFIFKLSGIDFINKMELGSLVDFLSIFVKLFGFQIFRPLSVPGDSYSRKVFDIFKLLLISTILLDLFIKMTSSI